MNKEFNYESPAVAVKEIMAEGVLCNSQIGGNALSIGEWGDEESVW